MSLLVPRSYVDQKARERDDTLRARMKPMNVHTYCGSWTNARRVITMLEEGTEDAEFIGVLQEFRRAFIDGRTFEFHEWIVVYRATEPIDTNGFEELC